MISDHKQATRNAWWTATLQAGAGGVGWWWWWGCVQVGEQRNRKVGVRRDVRPAGVTFWSSSASGSHSPKAGEPGAGNSGPQRPSGLNLARPATATPPSPVWGSDLTGAGFRISGWLAARAWSTPAARPASCASISPRRAATRLKSTQSAQWQWPHFGCCSFPQYLKPQIRHSAAGSAPISKGLSRGSIQVTTRWVLRPMAEASGGQWSHMNMVTMSFCTRCRVGSTGPSGRRCPADRTPRTRRLPVPGTRDRTDLKSRCVRLFGGHGERGKFKSASGEKKRTQCRGSESREIVRMERHSMEATGVGSTVPQPPQK